jgi:hypothetical protein
MTLVTGHARAYVNHGVWKADCPRKDCTNARALSPREGAFHCNNCQLLAPIAWPTEADAIWRVLSHRPVPQTRNWYPAGHELAERLGIPTGQSVKDLHDENKEHGV